MSYNEHLTAGLASIWGCTASEATERIAPKRKRVSQESGREDVPWTAARCNRLLRTITSRVNILRKQSKLCAAGRSARNTEQDNRQEEKQLSLQETPPSKKSFQSPTNDPQWVPGAKLNAPARTYGNRSKGPVRSGPRKADSGFSTPFVKRLLKDETPLFNKSSSSELGQHDFKRPPKKLRQLPVQLASSNEEAQRNLVTAFGSVLTATSEPSEPERTGARSLMSSCLRRVPQYVDLETQETNQEDSDKEDVTSSIYIDLESLGTNSAGGWSGLREVVRSHCVHHICAVIEEELIHESRILELVTACSKNGAIPEADLFLHTWLSRAQPGASDRMSDSYIALSKIAELRSSHDAPEMYLRRHTWLVDSERVWISDVLRPGSTALKDLIKALIRGPGQDAALAYLESAVLKDFATSSTAALPVFTRLAGLLASIAITQTSDSTELSARLGLHTIIHRIAVSIQQIRSQPPSGAIHPFVMADALLQLTSLPADPLAVTQPLATSIAAITLQQTTFVKFACNVAHHVFRFSDANELESLLLTTSGFLAPPAGCSRKDRDVLSRLGFETAFAYSELTGIDIDHHFADRLTGDKKTPASNVTQTPRRRVQVSGFKWEEGLCEWVAATPLPPSNDPCPQSFEHDDCPKQLLTPTQTSPPKRKPRNSVPVFPSSPDIIAGEPARQQPAIPPKIEARRPALQERSANRQPPTQTPLALEKEKKTSVHSVPIEGKQVHLKVERAKKAARLAQAAVAAQAPKQLKRSQSVAGLKNNTDAVARRRTVAVDQDELGVATPARKKAKGTRMPQARKQASGRASLPARVLDVDGVSDDELGM